MENTVAAVQNPAKSTFHHIDISSLFRDNTAGQWLILLALVFSGFFLGKLISQVLSRSGKKYESAGLEGRGQLLSGLSAPIAFLGMFIGLGIGLFQIHMSPLIRGFSDKCLLLAFIVSAYWILNSLITALNAGLLGIVEKSESKFDDLILSMARKSLRMFLAVMTILFTIDSVFEKDIGAWLTGLGVVGLGVSLAAQDSLKNLFGSLTILLDQPFQIGDRIIFGGYDGTVEDIGLRSVRIRTGVGSLVTVPNSIVVNEAVENIARRPSIKRNFDLTITCDTPPERIRLAVQLVKDILASSEFRAPIHPVINNTEMPPRVFFNEMKDSSWNISVTYWYAPADYWPFMEHAEALNLRILEEFANAGIDMAYPSQTLFLAGDEKRKLAVKVLRGENDTYRVSQ